MFKNSVVNVTYCYIPETGNSEIRDNILFDFAKFTIQDEVLDYDTGNVLPIHPGQGSVYLKFLEDYTTKKFSTFIDTKDPRIKRFTDIIMQYFYSQNPPELHFLITLIFRGFELGDFDLKNPNTEKDGSVFLRLGSGAILLPTKITYADLTEEFLNQLPLNWERYLVDLEQPSVEEIRKEVFSRLESIFDSNKKDALFVSKTLTDVHKIQNIIYYQSILYSLRSGYLVFCISDLSDSLIEQLYELYSDMLNEFNKSGIKSQTIQEYLECSKSFFNIKKSNESSKKND